MDKPNEDTTTTPAKGDDEIAVPEGAENPDAVKTAIKKERDARKAAEKRASEAEEQVNTMGTELTAAREALTDLQAETDEKLSTLEGTVTKMQADAAPTEALLEKYRVAAAKKLPLEFAERLQGDDKAALEADADSLLPLLGSREDDAPDFDGGTRRTPKPKGDPTADHNGFIGALLGGGSPPA